MKAKYNLTYRESKKDLLAFLKWIDGKEAKGVTIEMARTALARIVPKYAKAEDLDDELLIPKFDFVFKFAYGESIDWRLKSAHWMVNFPDANTELSQSHIDELRKFDETVARHVPTIDDEKKSKEKINEAK